MTPITYFSFGILTLVLVALDIWQTRGGQITIKKAAVWSVFWFALAFLFAATIYLFWDFYAPGSEYTAEKATVSFITGYLLEKSLSVDNLFVFAIIFHQYAVPEHLRPRALLWGVIGALILRAIMIAVGSQLLAQYHWVLYVFALFLIWTGIQLARDKGDEEINPLPERLIRRFIPVSESYRGNALTVVEQGKRIATPMFIVIAVIAFMDVMFALDSIPAIFAVTREPFLVLAANVFALLGLRSLYFVLQGMMDKFIYLKPALSFIMVFIGIKMMLVGSAWEIPTVVSLLVLLTTMTIAVIASVIKQKNESARTNVVVDK
ncbi:TerC/Alx family metal homeostasis membrane protein [Vibrio europaeus]|uniref:TerC/Alx family metal homeostasis membrane protein n=1 Tax=Vibrio europaeus TaxID=300876 RepID=A0A178J891_9VIBR|nr:TerC/Alx family metal homeostasis membrane protein [Vibrio europaeus]MDC5704865.1 TerC/Alx family metal homeostasis membrane protein [Vibrio europaeus]MDC5710144.1 TerC/Alx family metal homeostasis membrane protein [Vibrio europaeus]MDC5715234.1 TerC/Alx family metal homeostasis membrane protein [Vibrio europaeus]MDC5718912.1 TerC/Alx family metal homeostasis membrane protein [Vibrio europaeus]MDC5724717.1 TerC/Alx family metal homeostasis membrane protein [Vibrio europaeus]